jgi:5-methyltetrahydrofolate--homocysteine methyltransferase
MSNHVCPMSNFSSLLNESKTIIADGAMGTLLFNAGLASGKCPELWNVEQPQNISDVHRAYLEAGSQILLTNTFGGNRFRLARHGLEGRVAELNHAAAQILGELILTSGKRALVAGDIGPLGQVMLPYGDLSPEQAVEAFKEQADALINGGVDLLWIETMADLQEVISAIKAIRLSSESIPIFATMTFDTHGRTMMGVTPEKAVQTLIDLGVSAVGGNCGNGPEEIITVIEKMRSKAPQTLLIAKANAGIPELVDGKPVYRASPADMAEYAVKVYAAGARIIGACCGSSPDHIHSIAGALAAITL